MVVAKTGTLSSAYIVTAVLLLSVAAMAVYGFVPVYSKRESQSHQDPGRSTGAYRMSRPFCIFTIFGIPTSGKSIYRERKTK